jgi:hypothetical protein
MVKPGTVGGEEEERRRTEIREQGKRGWGEGGEISERMEWSVPNTASIV